MSEVEILKDRLDSRKFSEEDCNHLERIITTTKEKDSDKNTLFILNESLEIVRTCGLLFSKLDSESSGTIRIDSTDWAQWGSVSVYTKLNAYLEEMRLNGSIVSLTRPLGQVFFFRLVNRIQYTYSVQEKIKESIKNIWKFINPNNKPGIQTVYNIVNRIDPDLQKLKQWVSGNNSKDFEKGVSLLLSLCGFNSLHIGDEYENASLSARRSVHKISKSNLDVISLSRTENQVLLCQCTVNSIENKIGDLLNISTEIARGVTENIAVYPIIITSVSKKKMSSSFDTAIKNRISVITIEDLEELIDGLRSGKSMSFAILNKLTDPYE